MNRFVIFSVGFGTCLFFGLNTVFTAIDGKPRVGAETIANSGVIDALASIPNPFAPDPSTFLLAPLPDAEGWQRREISDPWTVRPIRPDGTSPTDEEMAVLAARLKSPESSLTYQNTLNVAEFENQKDQMRGAARTAANYANEAATLNVLVERLPEAREINPDGFNPLERYFYEIARGLSVASELMTAEQRIAGMNFQGSSGRHGGTQSDVREATVWLQSISDGYAMRIWGIGSKGDVADLIEDLREGMGNYPLAYVFNRQSWL